MHVFFPHILGFKKEHKKSVKMASKKVYFLTVWASENREYLQGLSKVVDIEYGKWCPCVSCCIYTWLDSTLYWFLQRRLAYYYIVQYKLEVPCWFSLQALLIKELQTLTTTTVVPTQRPVWPAGGLTPSTLTLMIAADSLQIPHKSLNYLNMVFWYVKVDECILFIPLPLGKWMR